VTEIIDHHNDSGSGSGSESNLGYKNLRKKSLIYPLGSCSSLVLLEHLKYLEEYLLAENTKEIQAEIFFRNSFKDFMIFISAILIDTRNFFEVDYYVRWTNLDVLAYNKIIELNEKFYFQNENCNYEFYNAIKESPLAKKLYEDLINSKYDLEANLNLGIKKLFNKDKKEFSYNGKTTSVIWSSLQVSLESLIVKFGLDNLKKEVFEALLGNKSMYVINYRQNEADNTFTFIAIFIKSLEENNKSSCLKSFSENFGNFLRCELKEAFLSIETTHDCFCLIKLNQTFTRKNFEPFLNKYFNYNNK